MKRTLLAFKFNANLLLQSPESTFWTLTVPDHATWIEECRDVKVINQRWNHFLTCLKRSSKTPIHGLRVIELHKSGVPHLHILFNRRIPISGVRRIGLSCGFGRIHVERTWPTADEYLTKYLSKSFRDRRLYGGRLWSRFGKWESYARVQDVIIDSPIRTLLKCPRYNFDPPFETFEAAYSNYIKSYHEAFSTDKPGADQADPRPSALHNPDYSAAACALPRNPLGAPAHPRRPPMSELQFFQRMRLSNALDFLKIYWHQSLPNDSFESFRIHELMASMGHVIQSSCYEKSQQPTQSHSL